MFNYLLEAGYSTDTLTSKQTKVENISVIRFFGNSGNPFLIAYDNNSSVDMDINSLFDICKDNGDEFCSMFVCCNNGECTSYSKNLKLS